MDTMSKPEHVEWKENARTFLLECFLDSEGDKKQVKLPKKMDRLASFYLLRACELQLQGQGLQGYSLYFAENTKADVPIEKRPLLVENMDSPRMCARLSTC